MSTEPWASFHWIPFRGMHSTGAPQCGFDHVGCSLLVKHHHVTGVSLPYQNPDCNGIMLVATILRTTDIELLQRIECLESNFQLKTSERVGL
eukprot:5587835-Amphidinium_carterae.1